MGARALGLPLWHPAVLVATGFGTGLLPVAPGTCGSLVALPFAWAIACTGGAPALAAAAVVAFFVGWWASAAVARASGIEDARAVVIDEIAGQWLVLVPASLDPLAYGLGFALFRIFDIWKPWPVRLTERRIKGGLGIMLDDLAAAVYAVFLLSALSAIGELFGVRS